MTRSRLAATTALTLVAVFVTASLGQAQGEDRYRATGSCTTKHTTSRDFAKTKTEVKRQTRPGRDHKAGAAAVEPAAGVKVIVKLVDLTPQNGNNIVGKAKKSDVTNSDGIAKTKHEFNNFGNYRLKIKAKTGGEVVATDTIDFGVSDRVSGDCDPPLTGRP